MCSLALDELAILSRMHPCTLEISLDPEVLVVDAVIEGSILTGY